MSDDWDAAPIGELPYGSDAGSLAESTWAVNANFGPVELHDPRAFQEAAARVTAQLLRRYGPATLPLVEDAVQDAFVAAARAWPLSGTPSAPVAWLTRVAQRRFLDRQRADRRLQFEADAGYDQPDAGTADGGDDDDVRDDQLRLLFLCCHPALSPESRVALTLKVAAQLSVDEIARLLRADRTAVAQRLVRAKRTLHDVRPTFVVPPPAEIPQRLDDVLGVCYALFAEGHLATQGDALVRPELCHEALRLLLLLASWPTTARAETHALLALLCLTAARLPARRQQDHDGAWVAVSLREQDRTQWSRPLIARGMRALAAAAQGSAYSRYHAEAEIAALHSLASSWETTPWPQIVDAYDRVLRTAPHPAARLSRWVAMAEAGAACAALTEIEANRDALEAQLGSWPEWPATLALLYANTGQRERADAAYARALQGTVPEPVRQYWMAARNRL
ncbi:RNA polymerase sigma factor [Gemmatimonas sp.]